MVSGQQPPRNVPLTKRLSLGLYQASQAERLDVPAVRHFA